MVIITATLYAVLGLIVGIAINALADDLPHHRRPERWRCTNCQAPRLPVAVLAYLTGRGKCARCGRRVGWRAVVVEVFTALVFAFLWLRYYGAPLQLAAVSFYLAIYILVVVTDFEHRLILNTVMFPAIGLAVVGGALRANGFPFRGALGAGLIAMVVLLAMYGLGALFGRLKGLRGVVPFGQGDVTLGVFIGLTTGPAVMYALTIGIVSAGIAALGYVLYRIVASQRSGLGSATMPYGPFLALGGALMVIWWAEVVAYYAV
jgi:leader peptidase (prepilin peptidase) / N-methyltransferase